MFSFEKKNYIEFDSSEFDFLRLKFFISVSRDECFMGFPLCQATYSNSDMPDAYCQSACRVHNGVPFYRSTSQMQTRNKSGSLLPVYYHPNESPLINLLACHAPPYTRVYRST